MEPLQTDISQSLEHVHPSHSNVPRSISLVPEATQNFIVSSASQHHLRMKFGLFTFSPQPVSSVPRRARKAENALRPQLHSASRPSRSARVCLMTQIGGCR
jgi:hypothetical protein